MTATPPETPAPPPLEVPPSGPVRQPDPPQA
jgi:hypothetical protein